MKRTGIFFLMVMALLVIPCFALSAERPVSGYGMGKDSCGKVTLAFSQCSVDQWVVKDDVQWPSKSRAYIEWVLGYITAFNFMNNQNLNLSDAEFYGVSGWIQKWCSDHPMDFLWEAAFALVKERTGYKDKNKFRKE